MAEPKRYRVVKMSNTPRWRIRSYPNNLVAGEMSERMARRICRLLNEDDARKEADRD